MFEPVSDDQWRELTDEAEISRRRAAAEKKFEDLSSDDIAFLRKKCKTDLFFLASGPLEYKRGNFGLHAHYCKWLGLAWGRQYRSTLFARDHYKSTFNTISDSVQMTLPNDAGVTAYPYTLGPDIKILLSHENRESASRFLYEITAAYTEKELMLALFPELIPSARKQRMNKWELDLPRKLHSKEPTFDTIGVGGAAQSRHFNWLKLDDLVGEEARDSQVVMKRTLTWFDNVLSLLERLKIDGWDLTGTHWSHGDVYAHAYQVYGVNKALSFIRNYFQKDVEKIPEGEIVLYGRGIEENGVPVFPEEFPADKIAILRKNPKVFAAQYANNPKDTELTTFQPQWLKFYNIGHARRLYVFAGETSWSVSTDDLDRVILFDPAVGETEDSDECGYVVTGTDKKLNIYILEAYKKRHKPPDQINELFKLYTKWWPRLVSIEDVAYQASIKYAFTEKCQRVRLWPTVHPYKPGSKKSKNARIAGLANYFASGQVYCLEGMTQFRDEYEWHPLGDSEHILDALAQGPEVWVPGLDEKKKEEMKRAEEVAMAERDINTGY